MGCDCSKPKPGPNGNQKPAKSLVASVGTNRTGATHVAPDGTRTSAIDGVAARAMAARFGGHVE
jgi:3-oxoacyl-(acyl-carrier-protein) synthase